jgi:hypothetical protein
MATFQTFMAFLDERNAQGQTKFPTTADFNNRNGGRDTVATGPLCKSDFQIWAGAFKRIMVDPDSHKVEEEYKIEYNNNHGKQNSITLTQAMFDAASVRLNWNDCQPPKYDGKYQVIL